MTKIFKLSDIDCPVCAGKVQDAVAAIDGVKSARVDFLVDENGEPFCLEANTLPGMTPTSLLPQEAAVEGLNYADLCEKIIEISLAKYNY